MKKNSLLKISEDGFRILLVVLGSIFAVIVMLFSVLALIKIQEQDIAGASGYLFVIFVVLGLSRFITWLKERTKLSLIRFIVLLVLDIGIGILAFFAKDNVYFYSICGGVFCLTIIISRVFKLIQNHQVRSIVYNSLIILFFALLAVGLFIPFEPEFAFIPMVIICTIVIFSALFEVLSNAFSQLKVKTLFKIIIRTFAFEIILGLLTLIVAASLVFMYFEDGIPTFGDGLWYSFAVVTTIGFGDFVATTVIGRIVTVLLGIYGIVVVAVITSIIVNFYNETAGKHDSQELKEIHKEIKNKNKNK